MALSDAETASPNLLDRHEERHEVGRMLGSAAQGWGQSLIVTGGAGTGKTAILQDAVVRARADGFRVMLARGSYVEHDVPLGLAQRLFDSVLTLEPEGGRDAALQAMSETGDNRRSLHQEFRKLLRSAPGSPVLVVVDNLHWADQQSLEWLVTLPEHVASLPVALLASLCDGVPGTDPALVDEFLMLSSQRVALQNLSAASVATLVRERLGKTPDPAFVVGVMRMTCGNPLLLAALTKDLVIKGTVPDASAADGLKTAVLDRLARAVELRLRRVSPHALTVLRTVAAFEEEATLSRLCVMVGTDPSSTAEVVLRLRRLGVLTEDRTKLRVSQELVRNAVVAEDTYGALREIHAQAARLLREEPGAEQAVCRHLLASAPIGEPWVPEVLASGARAAMNAADPQTAVILLRRALAEPLPTDVRVPVLFEIANAAARTDLVAAAAYLEDAIALSGPGDRLDRITLGLIVVLILGGDDRQISRLVAPGSGVSSEQQDAIHWLMTLVSGFAAVDTVGVRRRGEPEPDEALPLASQAYGIAGRGHDRQAAVAMARRVLKMTVAAPEDLVARVLACRVLTIAGLADEAVAQCDAASQFALNWGHRFMTGLILACRGLALHAKGDLRAAEAAIRQGLETVTSCRVSEGSSLIMTLRAMHVGVLVDLGRLPDAMSEAARWEPVEERPTDRNAAQLLYVRGRLRVRTGQPLGGVRDLIACGEWVTGAGITNPAVADWRGEAAVALYELGDVAQARTLADDELAAARLWGTPAAVGRALRLMARVGSNQGSRALLERSISLLSTSGEKIPLAQALTDLAGHLIRQGDKPLARDMLRQALALAEEAGHTELIGRSRDQLTASGGRPKRAVRAGLGGLTESERRVAELAATQKTNKAIAAMLFVGQRTVEIHLTNVYRKLGIAGRDQLRGALRAPAGAAIP